MGTLSKEVDKRIFEEFIFKSQTTLNSDSYIAVGFSGGLDSSVLLKLCVMAQKHIGFKLIAIHINHGINVMANDWQKHCANVCHSLGVPLESHAVEVPTGPCLEGRAREKRFDIFRKFEGDFVALGHHLDDQIETILLRLLRGGSICNLRGMSEISPLLADQNTNLWRPLLDMKRSFLEQWAVSQKLDWIDDPENSNLDHSRNFLRHDILPRLSQKFPRYINGIMSSRESFNSACLLLRQISEIDDSSMMIQEYFSLDQLRVLDVERIKNWIIWSLRRRGICKVTKGMLIEAARQVTQSTSVSVDFGDCRLRSYAGRLYWLPKIPEPPKDFEKECDFFKDFCESSADINISQLQGNMKFSPMVGDGISLTAILQKNITFKLRTKKAKIYLSPKSDRGILVDELIRKKGIPPWERKNFPLLYIEDIVVAVPGIAVASDFRAVSGERGYWPTWHLSFNV